MLREIYELEKSLSNFTGWTSAEKGKNYVWFNSSLEHNGVTIPSLELHGGCFLNRPDREISFNLRFSKSKDKSSLDIERCDWRPLTNGHTNTRKKKLPIPSRVIGSHVHSFELNYVTDEDRMRNELRYAEPYIPDPNNFKELRADVGRRFNIKNINLVLEPEWVYDLFGGE